MEYLKMAIDVTAKDGRLSYLRWNILNFAALVGFVFIIEFIKHDFVMSANVIGILAVAIYLCLGFTIAARRFNDLDMSHWHFVGLLIPIWNLGLSLYMLFAKGKPAISNIDDDDKKV